MTGQLVAFPNSSLRSIARLVLPEMGQLPRDGHLNLVIRISAKDIVARDFAAFLGLLDRIYGRSHGSFRSYSLRQSGYFTFARCQSGSWELIAQQTLSMAAGSSPLLLIWLVLKYLPSAVLSVSSAYNEYEQARLAKISRQRIREEIKRGGDLDKLNPQQRAEVARMIEGILRKEALIMPRVRRFMAGSFIGVGLFIDENGDALAGPDSHDSPDKGDEIKGNVAN